MPSTLTIEQLAYQTLQKGKAAFSLAHKTLAGRIGSLFYPAPEGKYRRVPDEAIDIARQRLDRVLETDWNDVDRGIYPASLLFDDAWQDFLSSYPMVWLDMPLIWDRLHREEYRDFATNIDTEGYPKYYLRNFHYQTDGYLSDRSADIYDLQVELLFNGAADAMRRRVLAPLKAGLQAFTDVPPKDIRVLDVACGTGRTLRFLRGMLPKAALFGMDLSPAYLRKATQLLSAVPGNLPQLLQGNAEELPYRDSYFHGVTCVFTFHELPPTARSRIIRECFRVLQPGGVFVICDSLQKDDVPELEPMMHNFQTAFHEPYFIDYIRDDITERMTDAGFVDVAIETHFMSKYWIARKP